ncbi:hypothetical protein CFC21_000578 [Triticum aestivum]|uniref:Uncharacterized protein n=1 Tax=Triticum aestivum TaxID=4565 RepID=A0A3B5XUI7_WHEAT|nr:uncharacterized protein LOC123083382 [Triticum aestivum]KAF6982151.1 hypothetical protein CFC21_000578 [Triticum aestivum]
MPAESPAQVPFRQAAGAAAHAVLPGGGSFKSSVRGYEASLSRLFSGRIARTSSLLAADDGVLSASVHAANKTPPSVPAAAEKTGMHRSQSLPMNMKLSSAKSIKRMNSLDGVYHVVPSRP